MENLLNNIIYKLGFLFVSYIIIASGYIEHVLPCQIQYFFKNNMYAKHIVGCFVIFMFIMMEGGWSFNEEEQNKHDVNWSNGNVIDTSIFAFILYSIFLISANMKLLPNLLFYFLLFIIYALNTQRLYWKNRNNIEQETDEKILLIIKILSIISIIVLIYGFYDYYIFKKLQFKKKFSVFKMVISNKVCKF